MKIRMSYFDMLNGRYHTAVQIGFNYVSSNRGNRYTRVKAKQQYRQMN